jgi:hypothetical protein
VEQTLELVPPGEHTAEDLQFLLDADSQQPLIERIPLLRVDHALRMGKMLLFRLHPGPGTMIAEIMHDNGAKRLELLRGAGRFAPSMHKILAKLWAYAEELGCECVTTVVYSERFKRALELSGASVEGWILVYPEIDHGQQEEIQEQVQQHDGAEAA